MTNRRDFLNKTAAAVTGGFLYPADLSRFDSPVIPNWSNVRDQFPLTKDRIYLNNGTIGPSPYPVQKAFFDKVTSMNERGEYGGYEVSREPLASFVKSPVESICLTHNTTEGINIVASGLRLEKGDEIIMTDQEHVGNALPWLNVLRRKGCVIRSFNPVSTAEGVIKQIDQLVTPKTRVIAIPHITCTTGQVLPVNDICTMARSRDIVTMIDGAHGLGSIPLDLPAMDCDFYASCGHKWLLGPNGTGMLYIRQDSIDKLDPVHVGAYSDSGWTLNRDVQELSGFVPDAHRFYYGTQNAGLSSGLKAAVEFMASLDMGEVQAYSGGLATKLINALIEMGDNIEVLTPKEESSHSTMITFRVPGQDYREVGRQISLRKFRIRQVPESGQNAIRISTHIYNSPEEIDLLIKTILELIK